MYKTKVLLASCSNPILATDIQSKLESLECKVNVIGELSNLVVSVMLDKPSVVCIHFHEFTHNALEVSKELFDRFGISTIFLVSNKAFKEAIDISNSDNVVDTLLIPFSSSKMKKALDMIEG